MPTTAHENHGIGRQAYKPNKQLQGLKIERPHSQRHRFCVPNYDAYWTDRKDRHKSGTAVAIKKGICHTCINLFYYYYYLWGGTESLGICSSP
jgi:hypothetical protein